MESLWKKNQDCHRQSSKSSVTLGAVWRTLTLAVEDLRSRRSVLILHLGPNHLHLSKVLLSFYQIFYTWFQISCVVHNNYVKIVFKAYLKCIYLVVFSKNCQIIVFSEFFSMLGGLKTSNWCNARIILVFSKKFKSHFHIA